MLCRAVSTFGSSHHSATMRRCHPAGRDAVGPVFEHARGYPVRTEHGRERRCHGAGKNLVCGEILEFHPVAQRAHHRCWMAGAPARMPRASPGWPALRRCGPISRSDGGLDHHRAVAACVEAGSFCRKATNDQSVSSSWLARPRRHADELDAVLGDPEGGARVHGVFRELRRLGVQALRAHPPRSSARGAAMSHSVSGQCGSAATS